MDTTYTTLQHTQTIAGICSVSLTATANSQVDRNDIIALVQLSGIRSTALVIRQAGAQRWQSDAVSTRGNGVAS